MLEINTPAPEFTLPDKDGNPVSLSDFLGKRVVVYFYPKDNTSGCTKQPARSPRRTTEYQGARCSGHRYQPRLSSVARQICREIQPPFILLSDPELTAIQAYGVWQEKKMCGKVSMGVVRTTFIISADGKIEKIMPKVKPDTNAADVLEYLRQN